MRTVRFLLFVTVAAVVATAGIAGCSRPAPEAPKPAVAPPVIGKEAVLRAGVDLTYPPFGGTENGQQAGLDIDVAKALAASLGLKAEIVDVKPADASSALSAGTVDVVLSVPLADATGTVIAYAGSYASDGPVFFSRVASGSVEPSLTIERLGTERIGVQEGSPAYWLLAEALGEESLQKSRTLRDALLLVSQGDTPIAAGDAIVGAYIARDMPDVRVTGQLAPAGLLGIATLAENKQLNDIVRGKLDELSSGGVLDTIRKKWVGDLPKLSIGSESATATP